MATWHWRNRQPPVSIGASQRHEALFRLEEDYSKSALAKAFVVRSLGRVPKQRSFTLRLGQQVTCLDLVGQESDPLVITEIVRKQYLESFF